MILYEVYHDFDCCDSVVSEFLFESANRKECEQFIKAVYQAEVEYSLTNDNENRMRIVERNVDDDYLLVEN